MEETEGIKGGVIIIGSLFWEDEKNCVAGKEIEGRARRQWRERNLDISKKQIIKLPTRYGRCSEWNSRRNTYTMVLSRDYLKKLGTGLVVPFNKMFWVRNKGKIGEQIKKLAKVEGIKGNNDRLLAKYWSAVAIWVNPKNKHSKEIIKYWQRYIVRGNSHGYIHQNGNVKNYDWLDTSLIDNNYQLELTIDTDLDFLLCTYMKPRFSHNDSDVNPPANRRYPNEKDIANAILNGNYSTYFCQNRLNGITTADDELIFKHISK